MKLVLAALAAAAASSVSPPATSPAAPAPAPLPDVASQASGLVGAEALQPFFRRLRADRGAGARPVVVLQLGDSHSAGDQTSGGLRARLQARFGEGGRGVLPPGAPFKAFTARQVALEQSPGWRLEAEYLPANAIALAEKSSDPSLAHIGYGAFGLAGFRLTSTIPGATLTMKADPEAGFDRAAVCALAGPGAGELVIKADGVVHTMALAAAVPAPVCESFDVPEKASELDLSAPAAPVALLSFATFRSGGVAVSNLGVIGARIDEFAARDDAALSAELKAYQPDLILLAFGTNDGFQAQFDPAAFEARFRGQLQRLKRLAPAAAILVLGPPDADTSRPDIPLDGVHNLGFDCAPLTPSETAGYDDLVRAHSPQLARWYPPPGLTLAREAERRAAAAEGVAFWDWQARMGGPCTAHRLAHAETPLMRGDHIHFNSEGGDFIASLLTHDLMAAYDASGGH